MSVYNTLTTELTCPRCGGQSSMEVELRLGYRNLINYEPGDTYRWVPGKAVQNGGRPDGGDIKADGYTECPICRKDFFVEVFIRKDVIAGAVPDTTKRAYIPD